MKINHNDLERWKENALETAYSMEFDNSILKNLEDVELEVMPVHSRGMFYGWADFINKKISVYELNPSRYFPKFLKEVWNQSGMDHELIGHIYNFEKHGDLSEKSAIETQIQMAQYRGKDSLIWKTSSWALPKVLRQKESNKGII